MKPTVGLEFSMQEITYNKNTNLKVKIWDTGFNIAVSANNPLIAGGEKFKSVVPLHFRNTDAAFIVYSINDKKSFNSLEK